MTKVIYNNRTGCFKIIKNKKKISEPRSSLSEPPSQYEVFVEVMSSLGILGYYNQNYGPFEKGNTNGGVKISQDGYLTELTLTPQFYPLSGGGSIISGIEYLTKLTNLVIVDLKGIKSTLPSELGNLTLLTNLNIEYLDVSGPIPSEIRQLTLLKKIRLVENHNMIGFIPSEIGKLTELNNLSISAMQNIKGQIPTQLGNLTQLHNLSMVSMTSLTGQIPTEIGSLTALNNLNMGYMGLNGQIPTQIVNLTELINLNIFSMSGLIGQIPTEIGVLENLTNLDMRAIHNLKGQIPTQLGNLKALKDLSIEQMSGLTGTIPTEIGVLENLTSLSIDNTCLQVDKGGIEAIKGLDIYKIGNVYLDNNCITKAQLPMVIINTTNCKACPSCKGIPACT